MFGIAERENNRVERFRNGFVFTSLWLSGANAFEPIFWSIQHDSYRPSQPKENAIKKFCMNIQRTFKAMPFGIVIQFLSQTFFGFISVLGGVAFRLFGELNSSFSRFVTTANKILGIGLSLFNS